MIDVRWTGSALGVLASLRANDQRTIVERLDLARQFPEMYPARQRGRFAVLRYFVANRRWVLYYRAQPGRPLVIALVPALARRR